jgi:hypothetical protein
MEVCQKRVRVHTELGIEFECFITIANGFTIGHKFRICSSTITVVNWIARIALQDRKNCQQQQQQQQQRIVGLCIHCEMREKKRKGK